MHAMYSGAANRWIQHGFGVHYFYIPSIRASYVYVSALVSLKTVWGILN